jgi:hypothetical protein
MSMVAYQRSSARCDPDTASAALSGENWLLSSGELPPDTSNFPSAKNAELLQKLLACSARYVLEWLAAPKPKLGSQTSK